jgi:thiol:disulfide interchange protein
MRARAPPVVVPAVILDSRQMEEPANPSSSIDAGQAYRPVWFLFAVLCALVVIMVMSRWMAPQEIIPWRADFAAAQRESAAASKPVLLYLTADWCGPCQELKHTTWADKSVEQALRSYVPVKVDVDQHADLAMRYGSNSIPRYVVLDKDGNIVKANEGVLDPREFIAWLNG